MYVKNSWLICLYLGCITLISSCCHNLYIHNRNQSIEPISVIGQSLHALTNITEIADSIKSGDKFLHILLPGIPMDESQISFIGLSGDLILGSVSEIDKAYIFSVTVNKIFESRNETEVRLDKFCIENNSFQDLLRITTPTYNDDFLFSTSTASSLCLRDDYGMFYTRSFTLCDNIKLNYSKTYTLSARFIRIPILRPWLSGCVLTDNSLIGKAYVSEIIVANDLQIMVSSFKNCSSRKITETILRCDPEMIIAFICTVF